MKLEDGEILEVYHADAGVYVVTAVKEAIRYLKKSGRNADCTLGFVWNDRYLTIDINESVEDVVNRIARNE